MNFQEKMMDVTAEWRARAMYLADSTVKATQAQARVAAAKVDGLRKSLVVLNAARREFQKVAGHHAGRFVKQNSPLIAAARKDVSELARSTYRTLATGDSPKVRRSGAQRKRVRKAA